MHPNTQKNLLWAEWPVICTFLFPKKKGRRNFSTTYFPTFQNIFEDDTSRCLKRASKFISLFKSLKHKSQTPIRKKIGSKYTKQQLTEEAKNV